MDVKCENCGTEYEFDDSKVTAAGITVKCTQCGHLFRVVRAPVEPEQRDRPDDAPVRPRHWMIRNRRGEVREFRDLATLQQWIVERKVARDDEISKTGESWKTLGSIVELASFFHAVDASAGRATDEILSGSESLQRLSSSAPPASRPPPFGAEDLMSGGRFRLEGPRAVPLDGPRAIPLEGGRRASGPPMPSTPLDTNPTVPIQRLQHPDVQVRRTPLPPEARGRVPQRRPEPEPMPGPRPGRPAPETMGRGFLMGVLATVALAGLAYFIYDQLAGGEPTRPVAAGPGRASGELYLTIERAEAEYEKDTEDSFARADADYAEVLRVLGEPPRDRSLAVRAHLGRARVAMARAEYRKLEGADPSVLLKIAEASLAEALRLDETEPGVALGYADFYRVQGSRQRANKFLAKVEAAGVDSDEANLVRAAVSVHNGDWAAAQSRLARLPASALDRPRARYLLAVALARSGRTEEAVFELTRLTASHPEHGPAARLLARLGGKAPAPLVGEEPVEPVEPPPAAVATAAPPTACPRVAPTAAPPTAARPVAPRSAAPRTGAPAPRPVARAGGFDGLMDRARKAQERGKNGEARRLLLEALSVKPGNAEALASLGWCDVDDGDYPRAISYFRRSLAGYAGYADARYGLAVALERAGNKDAALAAYEDYLRRHPTGRRTNMVQDRITRLRGG
ncbi:MAG: zinc-ribbon domain-containing protein [Myxococcales bacterium]|nr:zinc-ribbon domain-containing protein [Myxococcales bacterium]